MSTILIVEDDGLVSMALQLRLQSLGYVVVTARDVGSAEQQAAAHRPDLILTDICLPDGDGFAVARQLNRRADGSFVPVVFATASLDPAMKLRATHAQAAGFLQKPYTTEQLLHTISQALLAGAPTGSDPVR